MNTETLAALEAVKREHPGWTITFTNGYRPYWFAWRVVEAPAALVSVECFSARVLRGRLTANDWIVTPGYRLEMNTTLKAPIHTVPDLSRTRAITKGGD